MEAVGARGDALNGTCVADTLARHLREVDGATDPGLLLGVLQGALGKPGNVAGVGHFAHGLRLGLGGLGSIDLFNGLRVQGELLWHLDSRVNSTELEFGSAGSTDHGKGGNELLHGVVVVSDCVSTAFGEDKLLIALN